MSEPCPPNLDADGRELWEQCDWILNGGATSPEIPLQMQALAIRRELRQESQLLKIKELLRRAHGVVHWRLEGNTSINVGEHEDLERDLKAAIDTI